MDTRFCGHKTAFNPTGDNDVDPNPFGPSTTVYNGRGAVPAGVMKRGAGPTADISGGNRRTAKAQHGDGGGSGTVFHGFGAFGNKERGMGTGRKPGGEGGGRKSEMRYNKK